MRKRKKNQSVICEKKVCQICYHTYQGNECIICVQFNKSLEAELKVQSCKYMTAATQIINTEISAFIAALVLEP